MPRTPRRRRFDTRRICLLLMLVFGLLLHPLMAVHGGVHEAFAHADQAHANQPHAGNATHTHDGVGDADDGGPNHVLSHYAHSHAQSQGFPPGVLTLPVRTAAAMLVEAFSDGIRPDARDGAPFRPPIRV